MAYTSYMVDLTYTAPSSCSSPWTFTTEVFVWSYSSAASAVPAITTIPASLATIRSTGAGGSSEIGYVELAPTVVLRPEDLLTAELASLQSYYLPTWAAACAIPAVSTYLPNTSNNDESDACEIFCITYGQELTIILAMVGGWFAFFFIFGLFQSWHYFRELCHGREARRGLPGCWVCLNCPLTCLLLVGMDRGFEAKSRREQLELKQRWEGLSTRTRLRQWLRWGFRRQYPPFLGPAPARRRKPPPEPLPRPNFRRATQPASNTRTQMEDGAHGAANDPPPRYSVQASPPPFEEVIDWYATSERPPL